MGASAANSLRSKGKDSLIEGSGNSRFSLHFAALGGQTCASCSRSECLENRHRFNAQANGIGRIPKNVLGDSVEVAENGVSEQGFI